MDTFTNAIISNKFAGIRRINSYFSNACITASDIQNVELFNTEINSGVGIRTMKGNDALYEFEDDDEKIINIFESVQGQDTVYFIHTVNDSEGKIYLYNPTSNTTTLKVSELSDSEYSTGVDFAQGWSDLFVFSNGVEILTIQLGHYNNNNELDEVTIFTPQDEDGRDVKGFGLVVYNGRLWIFDKNVLWYSVKGDCYHFNSTSLSTSGGYIEFVKNITAIAPYLGSLAVFHKDSSCLVNTGSDDDYSVSDESPGGCASANSLVFHGTQLYFYDDTKKSVFAFSQIVNGDKTLSDNLAKDVQNELMKIKASKVDDIKMISVIQSDRNEIWFLLPSEDDTSTVLIFDYLHSEWVKRKSQKLKTLTTLNGELYSSSNNKILKEYMGETFDGEIIEAFYKCSALNLGVDNTMKILYTPPRITLDMSYNSDFYIRYINNYDSLKKQKNKHIKAKAIKDIFYWDISYWDSTAIFKPKETNSIKRMPVSCFQTLEIHFYTKTKNQGFAIKNIEFSKIKVKQL